MLRGVEGCLHDEETELNTHIYTLAKDTSRETKHSYLALQKERLLGDTEKR